MAYAAVPGLTDQLEKIKQVDPPAWKVLVSLRRDIFRDPQAGLPLQTIELSEMPWEIRAAKALRDTGRPGDARIAKAEVPSPHTKPPLAIWIYFLGPPTQRPEHAHLRFTLMTCNVILGDGTLLVADAP